MGKSYEAVKKVITKISVSKGESGPFKEFIAAYESADESARPLLLQDEKCQEILAKIITNITNKDKTNFKSDLAGKLGEKKTFGVNLTEAQIDLIPVIFADDAVKNILTTNGITFNANPDNGTVATLCNSTKETMGIRYNPITDFTKKIQKIKTTASANEKFFQLLLIWQELSYDTRESIVNNEICRRKIIELTDNVTNHTSNDDSQPYFKVELIEKLKKKISQEKMTLTAINAVIKDLFNRHVIRIPLSHTDRNKKLTEEAITTLCNALAVLPDEEKKANVLEQGLNFVVDKSKGAAKAVQNAAVGKKESFTAHAAKAEEIKKNTQDEDFDTDSVSTGSAHVAAPQLIAALEQVKKTRVPTPSDSPAIPPRSSSAPILAAGNTPSHMPPVSSAPLPSNPVAAASRPAPFIPATPPPQLPTSSAPLPSNLAPVAAASRPAPFIPTTPPPAAKSAPTISHEDALAARLKKVAEANEKAETEAKAAPEKTEVTAPAVTNESLAKALEAVEALDHSAPEAYKSFVAFISIYKNHESDESKQNTFRMNLLKNEKCQDKIVLLLKNFIDKGKFIPNLALDLRNAGMDPTNLKGFPRFIEDIFKQDAIRKKLAVVNYIATDTCGLILSREIMNAKTVKAVPSRAKPVVALAPAKPAEKPAPSIETETLRPLTGTMEEKEEKIESTSPKEAFLRQADFAVKQQSFTAKVADISKLDDATRAKFDARCGTQLATFTRIANDPNAAQKDKDDALATFTTESTAFLDSLQRETDEQNAKAQRTYNIVTGIITAAAILIGAVVAGVAITVLSGGTLTIPYLAALLAVKSVAIGTASAGALLATGGLTFGLFRCLNKPTEKMVDSAVTNAVGDINTAAKALVK